MNLAEEYMLIKDFFSFYYSRSENHTLVEVNNPTTKTWEKSFFSYLDGQLFLTSSHESGLYQFDIFEDDVLQTTITNEGHISVKSGSTYKIVAKTTASSPVISCRIIGNIKPKQNTLLLEGNFVEGV